MTDKEFYDRLYQQNIDRMTGCGTFMVVAVIAISLIVLIGCKTPKVTENTDTKDSIRTEYIEKIVKDTVTIEIPAEAKERETRDSTSLLETSIAKSLAKLTWKDGEAWLFHSLENKPQKIEKEILKKEYYKTIYRTRYVTRTKTIEKKLSWWQQAKLDFSGYIIGILLIFILIFAVYLCIKKKLRRQGISS